MFETFVKFSMAGLLLATVPVGGDISAWSQWGLAGLVVGYTVIRDWYRERRMSEAIEKHNDWVRSTLLQALERNTLALEKMSNRPCMSDAPKVIHGQNH
jgi:hypothetical protein